jgi:MoaA/NifB/PqqE/SkfB family radical SAM enzyme
MRGPHYDALMNTVDYLRNLLHEKHKKTPQLRFDLVITRKTYREIADFITFCISKGVHHAFFHPLDVREYDTQAQDALVRGVPIDELTSQLRDAQRRAARNGVSTNIPALLRNMHVLRRLHRGEPLSAMKRPVCVLPWLGMFVTVTGEVSPCCAMYPHGALSVGNLLTQDIDEVWNGSKMSTMRKSFKNLKNYQLYDGCAYCMPMSVASLVSAAKTFPGYIKELFKKHAAR